MGEAMWKLQEWLRFRHDTNWALTKFLKVTVRRDFLRQLGRTLLSAVFDFEFIGLCRKDAGRKKLK